MIREIFDGFGPERKIARATRSSVAGVRVVALLTAGALIGSGHLKEGPSEQAVTLHCEEISPATTRVLHLGEGTLSLEVDGPNFKATKIGVFRAGIEELEKQNKEGEFKTAHKHTSPVSVKNAQGKSTEVAEVTTIPDQKNEEVRLKVACQGVESD